MSHIHFVLVLPPSFLQAERTKVTDLGGDWHLNRYNFTVPKCWFSFFKIKLKSFKDFLFSFLEVFGKILIFEWIVGPILWSCAFSCWRNSLIFSGSLNNTFLAFLASTANLLRMEKIFQNTQMTAGHMMIAFSEKLGDSFLRKASAGDNRAAVPPLLPGFHSVVETAV